MLLCKPLWKWCCENRCSGVVRSVSEEKHCNLYTLALIKHYLKTLLGIQKQNLKERHVPNVRDTHVGNRKETRVGYGDYQCVFTGPFSLRYPHIVTLLLWSMLTHNRSGYKNEGSSFQLKAIRIYAYILKNLVSLRLRWSTHKSCIWFFIMNIITKFHFCQPLMLSFRHA